MLQGDALEMAQRISPLYRDADRRTKGQLLDQFVVATGYHRKAAIRLLLQLGEERHDLPRGRPRRYNCEVVEALRAVWEASDCLCSARLKPFIPELVDALCRHSRLEVPEPVGCCLSSLSRSTIDRLLRPFRQNCFRLFSTTKPGSLLTDLVSERKSPDHGASTTGLLTVDAVPHSGQRFDSDYLTTITAQDLTTGWSECSVVWAKQRQFDLAIDEIRRSLPFSIHQIETTDGDEILNESLNDYCRSQGIVFISKGCPPVTVGPSNSQKNWTVARRLVGFERYSSPEEQHRLKETYSLAKLYMNFFQPHRRAVSRQTHDGKVEKVYDEALTPYRRVLEAGGISLERERELRAAYERLDPLQLRASIYAQLEQYRPTSGR